MGDELKDSLLSAVMDCLSTSESTERSVFTQSDQVNILWSFASLEITPAKFFESISLATDISEGLGPEMMAKLLWALAVSETSASDTVLQKIASDAEKMASRLKRKDLEVAVTSLEKLGKNEHADRLRRIATSSGLSITGSYSRPQQSQKASYKTKLCVNFASGFCKNGIDCPFAHGEGELRNQDERSDNQTCTQPVDDG